MNHPPRKSLKGFRVSLWSAGALATLLPIEAALAGPFIAPGWGAPVFEDQFDGDTIDYSRWQLGNFANDSNNEQQYYHPDQVLVYDGGLHLWAERDDQWTHGRNYNSGQVRSWQEWSHGRFEVRAKVPYGQGYWPAIWLLPREAPWPAGGEIDIMEARGDLPYRVSSALHWGWDANSRQYRSQAYESGANFQAGYHDFAVEWEVGTVRFYVDGVNHMTLYEPDVGIPATPKSIVLNLAVGGDYSGPPDWTTPFPASFDIDYVRVWQRQETPAPPISLIRDAGFEDNGGALEDWTAFGNRLGNVASDWGTPRDGERSLKLYGQFTGVENHAGVFQSIEVTGGTVLTAGAHALIRSEDSIVGTANQAQMKIEFYREAGAAYGSSAFLGESIATLADGSSPEDTWQFVELTTATPHEAVEARLTFAFLQPGTNDSGSVFIDSVSLAMSMAGDYNDSGSVEQGDLDLVLNNWGGLRSAGFVANADGFATANVDQEELDRVLNNWGGSAAADFRGSNVPEPLAGAMVTLLALLRWRPQASISTPCRR